MHFLGNEWSSWKWSELEKLLPPKFLLLRVRTRGAWVCVGECVQHLICSRQRGREAKHEKSRDSQNQWQSQGRSCMVGALNKIRCLPFAIKMSLKTLEVFSVIPSGWLPLEVQHFRLCIAFKYWQLLANCLVPEALCQVSIILFGTFGS